MYHNDQGTTIDRVGVLLDSPGPPAAWGGWHTTPLRVLLVPLGLVGLPGQEQEPVDYESLSARELARLGEVHRQAQREARDAQYRLTAPGCHRRTDTFRDCWSEYGATAEMADGTVVVEGCYPPNGWCWWCWNRYEIARLVAEVVALEDALRDRNDDEP